MNKSMFLTLLCLLPLDVSAKEVNTPKETFMQKLEKKKDLIKNGVIISLIVSTGLGCGYLISENNDLKKENLRLELTKDNAHAIIKKIGNVFIKVNDIRREFHDLKGSFEKIKANTADEHIKSVDGEIVFRSMASRDLEEFEKKFSDFNDLMKSSPHSLEDFTNE